MPLVRAETYRASGSGGETDDLAGPSTPLNRRQSVSVLGKRKAAPTGQRFPLGPADDTSRRQLELWQRRIRCDVTLHPSAGMAAIPAHSVVLAGWSEYFARHFESQFSDSSANEFTLNALDGDTLHTIVEALYTRELWLTPDSVQAIIEASSFLVIPKVTQACEQFMGEGLAEDSCVPVLNFAARTHLPHLKARALLCCRHHLAALADSDAIAEIEGEELLLEVVAGPGPPPAASSSAAGSSAAPPHQIQLRGGAEADGVVTAVLAWAKEAPGRAAALPQLFGAVDWPCVSSRSLKAAAEHPAVRRSPECLHLLLSALLGGGGGRVPGGLREAGSTPQMLRFLALKERESSCWCSGWDQHSQIGARVPGILVSWLLNVWHVAITSKAAEAQAAEAPGSPGPLELARVPFVAARVLEHYVQEQPDLRVEKVQLVGSFCIQLAARVQGLERYLRDEDLEFMCDHAYPLQEIREQRMRNADAFVHVAEAAVTPLEFLEIFQECIPRAEGEGGGGSEPRFPSNLYCVLAMVVLEFGLIDIKMQAFLPSVQALAALFLSLLALGSAREVRAAQERLQEPLHLCRGTRSLHACMHMLHRMFNASIARIHSGLQRGSERGMQKDAKHIVKKYKGMAEKMHGEEGAHKWGVAVDQLQNVPLEELLARHEFNQSPGISYLAIRNRPI